MADVGNAVAEALLATPPRGTDAAPELNGTLGAVLFLGEWGEVTGERAYADAAALLLDEAIDAASGVERPTIGLYGTPLGVAWVDALLHPSDEESDVDLFVANALSAASWPGGNDLMHGLAGVGTYCLARLPDPLARRNLERLVAHLASTVREDADGVTWPYVPAPGGTFAFNEHRPEGHVNLGFAHGVPAIVAFLAAAAEAGVAGAGELLGPAVRWVVAHRLPPGAGAAFPAFVIEGGRPQPARLGWCYGDPGIAVALRAAGVALGDGDLVAVARDVALGCTAREDVDDATLCHGSSGLGHMFNRLGQAFGEERLLDAARRWYGVTVDRHREGLTVVDREVVKRLMEADGDVSVDAGYGLLFGAAGAGLALASAISDREPRWDAALFVRSP